MLDVLIAGAGPAGAIAALVLARAGARVLIVDRERFPRDKLCGDTLNPGAVGCWRRSGSTGGPLDRAVQLAGMRADRAARQRRAAYGEPPPALAITAARFRRVAPRRTPSRPARASRAAWSRGSRSSTSSRRSASCAVSCSMAPTARRLRMPAILTIAADGRRRRSRVPSALTATPRGPRRWAFGTYATRRRRHDRSRRDAHPARVVPRHRAASATICATSAS